MHEGVLIKAYGGFYYVRADGRTWELRARGRLRRAAPRPSGRMGHRTDGPSAPAEADTAPLGAPVVGDRVMFTPVEDGSGTLEAILPRSNVLLRPRVANVNQALLVVSLARPEPDLKLTDRMLVCCQSERIQALICFNKLDLTTREEAEKLLSLYGDAGYYTIAISAVKGVGLDTLRRAVDGKVSVLAGPSGAGKSTIINALEPGMTQGTGEISRKLGRGRHTTRHAELLPVAGGFIADTPGFSSLDIPLMDRAELANYFPEIKEHAGECRFLNCMHHNEPDCSVKQAVDNGLIVASRYQSYLSFLAEVLVKERTYS